MIPNNITIKVILFLMLATASYAQHTPSKERGDPSWRGKAQMEGNQVRATMFNYGLTGRQDGTFPISVQTPYEWPKNTGKVYLALTGIFVGGEVVDNNGVTQRIIDVMDYRRSTLGKSWSFEPVPGYYKQNPDPNLNEIANSANPETWPDLWPDKLADENDPGWRGSWNGYFGKNRFNADQEIFYRASDDLYDRYADYFPDTTDISRKGLGIILDGRILAWSQILVEDVIYILQTVKNDGTRDIAKVGTTVWFADFVGGNGDSNDDISEFDLIEDILWARDTDHRAPDFGNDPVGIVAVSLLETPGNATDRIDNDGDGEPGGPKVTEEMLAGEISDNLIDDNGNGLIDENQTHIPFGVQVGVSYADFIDQNGNAEAGSPVVTAEMINQASADVWKIWPPNPAGDPVQQGIVHLLMVESDDLGRAFKDNIDNDDNGEEGSPVVTQEMINAAAADAPYFRYRVPGTNIILYDLKAEDLGKKYADGIDNDENIAVDEFMDNGIDEMIDEARNDGIDNDGDWNVVSDDVGLDGVPNTGDFGENDGKPTPGRGGLPGEPNIDVTDVSETDQIGITNAQKIAAGGLNIQSDAQMWFDFMIPGKFFEPFPVVAGEYDLFVSTSFFPLRAGQTEPVSMAVILANAPVPDPNGTLRKQEVLKKRVRAQETYNNDYQFAQAPFTPLLTAVPGNNRVTLYWDEIAESSFDNYIAGIGGDGFDFEGYKIFRSSDPAFEDVRNITNAFGTLVFKTPIAVFDLENGIKGLDSLGFEGVHYYLGDDTGLKHSFVDTTVQNGFTYYYALVSYDRGFPIFGILPSESPIRINIRSDGSAILGRNVARVIPEASAAGFEPATLGEISLIRGTTTGFVGYEILDPDMIKEGHVYYVTFEDTLIAGSGSTPIDTLKTKNFSLIDSTANVLLIDRSTNFGSDFEQPLIDGFRLYFDNEERVELNKELSGWNTEEVADFIFEKFRSGLLIGEERPNDYIISFGEVGVGTSTEHTIGPITYPAIPVNFQVFNNSTGQYIDFAFIERHDSTGPGRFSAFGAGDRDRIVFLEPNIQGSLVRTWWFYLPNTLLNPGRMPQAGDTAYIVNRKPFLSSDIFRFTASKGKINQEQAKLDLDKIKVVPNPYIGTAAWETQNPYQSGRGPRSLHFTHLPNKCTIRIFTINGELVDVIEHESTFANGTAYWDMLTRDNLAISYGVYVFHIEAPGIGEKIGKFAVIK